jgi:son of sevenless-like protein
LKKELENLQPPCIPYIGMYQTQITLVKDANPDYLDNEKKIINFSKRMVMSQIIENIYSFKKKPYQFKKINYLQKYLNEDCFKNIFDDEDDFYDLSKKIEN